MAIAVETGHIATSGGVAAGLSLSIDRPAVGETIVVMVGLDRSDRHCTAIDDENGNAFTIIEEYYDAVSGGIGEQGGHFAHKTSNGLEDSIELTMNTNNKHGASALVISGVDTGGPEAQAEDTANISTSGSTIASPAVSNTTADAIAVAGFAGEQGNYWNGTSPGYSNSWQYENLPEIDGDGAGWLAYKILSSTGAQQTTYDPDDSGSNRYSAAAIFPIAGGGGGITGSGTPTEDADTSAASGQIGHQGSGTPSEDADTSAAAGKVGHQGSGTSTEGADTSAGAGTIASGIAGSGAPEESADTSAASGQVGHQGAGTPTESADTSAGAGVVSLSITGSGTPTEGPDTSAGVGAIPASITGSGAVTERPDTSAGIGAVPQSQDEYAGWPSRDFYAPYWMGTVPQHEIDAIAKERARHERKRLGLPVADEVPARVERVITSVARKQAKRRPGPETEQITELRRTIERQNAQWDEGFASELTALRKQFREAEESRKAVKAAKKRADKAEREHMRSAAKQEIERRERLAEIERRRKRNHNIATTALLLSAA